MIMKKEDYINLGKWIKNNSVLQIPASKVDEYFAQLEQNQIEIEKLKSIIKELFEILMYKGLHAGSWWNDELVYDTVRKHKRLLIELGLKV